MMMVLLYVIPLLFLKFIDPLVEMRCEILDLYGELVVERSTYLVVDDAVELVDDEFEALFEAAGDFGVHALVVAAEVLLHGGGLGLRVGTATSTRRHLNEEGIVISAANRRRRLLLSHFIIYY